MTPDGPPARTRAPPARARFAAARSTLTDARGTPRVRPPRPDRADRSSTRAVTVHDPRVYGACSAERQHRARRVVRRRLVGRRRPHRPSSASRTASLSRTHPRPRPGPPRGSRPVVDPIARRRRPDKQRDRRNVRAHYDLGNDFFQRFLDDTMMYSCAVFDAPGQSLADASRAKLDRLARLLELGPGDRVLEIGTGWGGFAIHAARELRLPRHDDHDLGRASTSTPARACREAGLDDRVTVARRRLPRPRGTFDKVVAIEMIEAVDWREYDTFFDTLPRAARRRRARRRCRRSSSPTQSFDRVKRRTDFIKAAIFPGGCLPVGRAR